MVEIIVRNNERFSFSLELGSGGLWHPNYWGAIGMGGVGKGEGTVYPLYSGIFVLLKKIVLKCVFQSLDSGYKFLQTSSNKRYHFHVHAPKCLPFFCIHRKSH